jgi:hypothetical protein
MLDERVVPLQMLVGFKKDNKLKLSYMTFLEKKGKKEVINSEASWNGWSDDFITVDNNFSDQFEIIGNNTRSNRQAINEDHMVVKHPLHGYSFELSMDTFLHICKQCDIIKGRFDIELIMDKKRDLLTREDYEEKILEVNKKEKKLLKVKDVFKKLKIKPKDVKIGHVYQNVKGKLFLYLGKHKEEYLYLQLDANDKMTGYQTIEDWRWDERSSRYRSFFTKNIPVILEAYYSRSYAGEKRNVTESNIYYYLGNSSLKVVSKPYSLSMLKDNGSDKDLLCNYTEEEWQLIHKYFRDDKVAYEIRDLYNEENRIC